VKNKALYFFLVALVAAGAFAGLVSSLNKASVEHQNTRVELVMDFNDIIKLSLREGISSDKLLKKFKDSGLTSISLTESTLEKLQLDGNIVWLTGYETGILEKINVPEKDNKDSNNKKEPVNPIKTINPALRALIRSARYDPLYSYIISQDKGSLRFAEEGLSLMLGRQRVKRILPDTLLVMDDEEDLLSMGIGIPEKDFTALVEKGFYVIPRLKNNYRLDANKTAEKLKAIYSYGPYDKIVFDGEEVGGFSKNLFGTAKALKKFNIDYGFIEMGGQKGDGILLNVMGADVVRVHSIAEDEMQKKMTKEEALNRFERAFYERGVRVLFIRPFYMPENGRAGLAETNSSYISDLKERLERSGFSAGKTQSLPPLRTGNLPILLLSLGLAAALCLLLRSFTKLPAWSEVLLLITSVAAFALFYAAGEIVLFRKLFALASALIFPVLSITSVFDLKKPAAPVATLSKAMSMVLTSFFIAAIGALYITGALADTAFMTGARQFMGVKIAFALPLLATGIYWVLNSEQFSDRKKLLDLLNSPVTFAILLCFAIVGGVGAIYILRSGNFGIGVLDIERVARSLLENLMSVRPRTKEFLIGYPALLLGALYYLKGKRSLLWAFLIVGTIGPVSTVNSFCHAHSPFMISVLRSFYGVLLGILAGIIYYLLYNLARRTAETSKK